MSAWGAHKWWRLANMITPISLTNFASLAAIEFRTSLGGPSVTAGGTASASSTATGTPAGVFDLVSPTLWTSNAIPAFIQYELPVAMDIIQISLKPRTDFPVQSPNYLTVKYSDDGTNFTTLESFFPAIWVANVYQTFTLHGPSANRYTQIGPPLTNTPGNFISASEIAFRTTYGGSAATGGMPGVRSQTTGNATTLFNGNLTDTWTALTGDTASYIAMDWGNGNEQNIVQIGVWPCFDAPSFTFTGFSHRQSSDGETWTTIASYTPAAWVAGTPQSFPASAPPITSQAFFGAV